MFVMRVAKYVKFTDSERIEVIKELARIIEGK